MESATYDLIILGAGPGGLTAGIYAARYNLNTLIIGKIPGGMAVEAHEICNFPSHEKIPGFELMKKMSGQVKHLGVEIKHEEVKEVKKTDKGFEAITNKNSYTGKKIIFATGSERRELGIEKEKKFAGKGVSYCATCDAGFFKDKIVGVVGGGNSALSAALLLARFATKVYIIYRKPEFFRAEPVYVSEVEKNRKIDLIFNSIIRELKGDDKLKEIIISRDRKEEEIKLDGLFIEIGSIPETKLAESLGVELDNNYIKVDKNQKTNINGVFAAGDVTNNPLKQIITSCGEGAVAAHSAYEESTR